MGGHTTPELVAAVSKKLFSLMLSSLFPQTKRNYACLLRKIMVAKRVRNLIMMDKEQLEEKQGKQTGEQQTTNRARQSQYSLSKYY